MKTTDAFTGLRCLDCDGEFEPTTTHRCPDCGGVLDPTYGTAELEAFHERLRDEGIKTGPGLGQFAPLLPFDREQLITLGEGATPLLESPPLADELGVERVVLKDEGRNATGGLADREMALAVTAASEHGASEVALPTTGNGGQAVAAYASRAGLDSHSFVPSRAVFANKAMINVHGGEMDVVGGRYPDAREAFDDAMGVDWYSLAPFETPYRHEGTKTVAYELFAALDDVPDAVVHPTGHGIGLVGIEKGFGELARTGTVDRVPRLYAAQPSGCAPVVTAWEAGKSSHDPVEHPDTICGSLEIPDPAGGSLVLDALDSTAGGAVAPDDEAILEAATSLSGAGIPTSATGGVAVSGAKRLATRDAFDANDTVVLIDPATANREADILRSHLMRDGI